MSTQQDSAFKLAVPLDASGIEGFKPDHPVKVLVVDRRGAISSRLVKLDEKGRGLATFTFSDNPGTSRVVVGPDTASDQELLVMQTISLDIPARQWQTSKKEVTLPVRIPPYYWYWWPIWCRTFTIRGRVLCPNGSPVPGATVCAYDVDLWWWWCSKQQVGCATTDATGAFQIQFRWCCGWWPWWWWARRVWQLEPSLADHILPVLQKELQLSRLPVPTPQPDPTIFQKVLAVDGVLPPPLAPMAMSATSPGGKEGERTAIATFDPAVLESLQVRLQEKLPVIPALERLHLWPWWPWHPWWDCTPDIIFRVTQNCHDQGTVIVDETCFDTRWDIPTTLNVTLVANEKACCTPPPHDCQEGDCVVLTEACDDLVNNIGGNIGAPVNPAGFENPGLVSIYGDRPYAGVVPIFGTTECMTGIDYYEFQWSNNNGLTWNDMPAAAAGTFTRTYLDIVPLTFTPVPFPALPIDGHNVYETLAHYEAHNPPPNWGITRLWVDNRDRLMNWLTENTFADGTYHLRVQGWNFAGGHLVNPRTVQNCGDHGDNDIVLTLDNRFVSAGPTDAHGQVCGAGTVHTCTDEPNTTFIAVKILHHDGTETDVGACSNVPINDTDVLQIDFVAYDPDGHLAYYTLDATYDVNLDINLLGIGGTLTPSPVPVLWAPAAAQVGPNYGDPNPAVSALSQGAISPIWSGGVIRLRVRAKAAFPKTCCYQLVLRAHKRTIVSCDYSLWGQTNLSEYSFTVVV